jgi:hypothetical protein
MHNWVFLDPLLLLPGLQIGRNINPEKKIYYAYGIALNHNILCIKPLILGWLNKKVCFTWKYNYIKRCKQPNTCQKSKRGLAVQHGDLVSFVPDRRLLLKSIQLNYKKGNQLSSALHRIRILYKNIRKKIR